MDGLRGVGIVAPKVLSKFSSYGFICRETAQACIRGYVIVHFRERVVKVPRKVALKVSPFTKERGRDNACNILFMGNGSVGVGVPRRYLMGHRMLSCVLSTGDFWRNESQGLEFTGLTVLTHESTCYRGAMFAWPKKSMILFSRVHVIPGHAGGQGYEPTHLRIPL